MSNADNKYDLELIENGMSTWYKHFGQLNWSTDGLGMDFIYPVDGKKASWYNMLIQETESMAAGCLGSLWYNLINLGEESFEESFSGISNIVKLEEFKVFVEKWFDNDGSVFKEPEFLDGIFGRFSSYGYSGFPDNDGEDGNELVWKEQSILIKLNKIGSLDSIRGQIYIDVTLDKDFHLHLNTIINMFKPD
jgi:hypothetical protein